MFGSLRHQLALLRALGDSRRRRLAVPWLGAGVEEVEPALREPLETIMAIDVAQRFLLGMPLNAGLGALSDSLRTLRREVKAHAPLRFGMDWQLWDPGTFYHEDGMPRLAETTRGIFESHASAYAAEFLRGCSPPSAQRAIASYVERNRVGLYRALEALNERSAGNEPLDFYAVLRLTDWAIVTPLTYVPGARDPADYLDSVLPAWRYERAVERFSGRRRVVEEVLGESATPGILADMHVFLQDGGVIGAAGRDLTKLMGDVIAGLRQWHEASAPRSLADHPLGDVERPLSDGILDALVRYHESFRLVRSDGFLFDPTIERFQQLCAVSGGTVAAYPQHAATVVGEADGDAEGTPPPAERFALMRALRRLLTGPEPDGDETSAYIGLLLDAAGADGAQLRAG